MQTALSGARAEASIAEPRTDFSVAALAHVALHFPPAAGHIGIVSGPRPYEITKRGIDLLLGTIGLALTGLLSIVLIPLIMRNSPGPPIFKQTRVGRGGRHFTCYKFRTMDPDAEARKNDLLPHNETNGPVFKMANDPRNVDNLRWLRKCSIDELPQLWNVIRGEMSLVGPRPPEPQEVARYLPHQLGRLAVKPGLTCTWQVNGRSQIGFEEWVEMDLDYIQRRNTLLDLKLIARTFPAVIRCKGAW